MSNIAWPADEELGVAEAMEAHGVTAVELAPTKIFDTPLSTSPAQRADYLDRWVQHGISVVALQSMLFGRLDLQLFDSAPNRAETLDYLSRFIELAGQLQAPRLVFGSPKNRRVPEGIEQTEAMDIAASFFAALGQVAVDNGTCFCIEPNPEVYDCNFIVNAAQGLELVTRVGHPGFGLHLDAAGMTLAGDSVGDAVRAAAGELKHFHASAPFLGPLAETDVDHAAAAAALREIRYDHVVSIEMRPGEPGEAIDRVARAITVAQKYYA